jgi:hypothetical protein
LLLPASKKAKGRGDYILATSSCAVSAAVICI